MQGYLNPAGRQCRGSDPFGRHLHLYGHSLGARRVSAIHLPAGGKDGVRFREILNAAQNEVGIPQVIYGNELGQELVIKIV